MAFAWKWQQFHSNSPLSLFCYFLPFKPLCAYRRLAEEEDELSEVQPDAVPPEVREWLASTFTRQIATAKKKSDEKPKFRSVAHAIRAGIFVDRIYRRVSSTALMQFPSEVVNVLKVNDNFEFCVIEKIHSFVETIRKKINFHKKISIFFKAFRWLVVWCFRFGRSWQLSTC